MRREFQINGIYHIFNRGVDKRTIFQKDQDHLRFILGLYYYNRIEPGPSIWTNVKDRPKQAFIPLSANPALSDNAGLADKESIVDILAFCLMSNHYHLILKEKTEQGISGFMQRISGYSRYFNKQYNRSGALFQGSYKCVPIKDDFQLVNIFNYVHTNPVEIVEPEWKDLIVRNKEKALSYLNKYQWSSYHDYVGNPRFPLITQRSFYLDIFNGQEGCKQSIYDWVSFKAQNAEISQFADYKK